MDKLQGMQSVYGTFVGDIEALFDGNKAAVEVQECEYEARRNTIMLRTEILKLDTGDTGTEVTIERIVEGEHVPEDFDIEMVVLVDELETLVSTTFYVLSHGGIEVHVAYNGFCIDDYPLEMYTGVADERVLRAIKTKLSRAVALYPEGLSDSELEKTSKRTRRSPKHARIKMVEDITKV